MEKKTKTILAVVIVVAVVVVGALLFFVVFQEKDDANKFLGAWKGIDPAPEGFNLTSIWIFYNNDTLKVTNTYSDYVNIFWYNYTIENNKLCIISQYAYSGESPDCLDYEFSNDSNRLTLSKEENILVFDKVQ